ncbi:low temperature requirement protein A [Marinobacter sp. MBR-105]
MVVSDLLWRRPRHYMDVDETHDRVHWVELFFDLVHVVTIFILGNYLSHHLGWQGFWVFTGLFLAIFYAWADSSVYNSLYISTDMPHRVAMALKIVTMMTVAAAIPDVGGEGWTYFALGYALNRALTAYLYWRARCTDNAVDTLAQEQGRNFFVLAGVFALSAFLPHRSPTGSLPPAWQQSSYSTCCRAWARSASNALCLNSDTSRSASAF